MKWSPRAFLLANLGAAVLIASISLASFADDRSYLDKGIGLYQLGKYDEALGMFGSAGASEFNNPVLHYYVGDIYRKQNLKDDAIREYEIALALQPKGTIADYCRQALLTLGITPPDKTPPPKPKAAVIPTPVVQDKPASNEKSKSSAWLEEQLGTVENERQQAIRNLQNIAQQQIMRVNTQSKFDRDDLRTNIQQAGNQRTFGGGNSGSNSNSSSNSGSGSNSNGYFDYQSGLDRIQSDNVAKVNEINNRLKKQIDDTNAVYDQRARAYQTSGSNNGSQRDYYAPFRPNKR